VRAFGASAYRLRDARRDVRLIYTGFLLLVLIGLATTAVFQLHLIGGSPAAVAAYYRGGEIDGVMSFPKTARQLVETTHFHAFIMGIVYLVLAHLFVATSVGPQWKLSILVVALAGLVGDLIAPWLIRYVAAPFAVLLPIAWAAEWVGFGAFIAASVHEMWFSGRETEIPPE
jgi:hypothetical protein